MLGIPLTPPGDRRPGRRLAVIASVVAVLLAALPGPATAGPPHRAGPTALTEGTGAATLPGRAAGGTHPVTLVTGDVAVLHVAPDGSQTAWLAEPATDRPSGPAQIHQLDGQMYAVPAEAVPYLRSGVLSRGLFNLTGLVRQGYDDRSRDDLPLLLGTPDGTTAGLPAGARQVRRLESIDAVSVRVDKSRMRDFWESVRGPQAALTSADAALAGAGRLWLNGRVRALLDDSVPHVGAPAAWDAGLDGSGTTVAVLDTGYDPEHPDLAGQVAGARNFTSDPDVTDGAGHGTHVAATVAGTGAASGGDRAGVAPGADLLIGKVLSDNGTGFVDWAIAGMEWAVEQDADVVNMSFGQSCFFSGCPGTDPLSQAVNRLSDTSDTLFVVAAGNLGPRTGTVTSPGAATAALTVGATTKDDRAADFSSRGPRVGDGLIKPEIVAPGVDIVAARAAGTAMGNLLGEHYTSAGGTSMAAPHVAGAAAILAQQHPDWDGERLKAHLVATSEWLPDQPVTFQGGGRLDVASAVTSGVTVDHGSLSFGTVDHDRREPVTRTLTYRNSTERVVTLRMSAGVTSTGADAGRTPVLTAHPAVLVIPPGGEASTEIRLLPHASRPGGYAGWITAADARGGAPAVRTVVSTTVTGPLHTVTVTGTDRDGEPAGGLVQLWSADTGELVGSFLHDGTATLQVPGGSYSLFAGLRKESGLGSPTDSYTMAGDPDLTVRRDLTLHLDARDGQPVRVTTGRDTVTDGFEAAWHREVGRRSVTSYLFNGGLGQQLYTLPSKPARTGTFHVTIGWTLREPLMRASFQDADGDRRTMRPRFATPPQPYVAQADLPVVDAGHGTPEEFAQVDAAGKVALVTRSAQPAGLDAQLVAAADAGAAFLLVQNTTDEVWYTERWMAPIPAYLLDRTDGEALRQALAADPGLRLQVRAISDATYSYQLAVSEPGVPEGTTYRAEDLPMAVVESDYRQGGDRMGTYESWLAYPDTGGGGLSLLLRRNGPVPRTEYLSTEGMRWQRLAFPHYESPSIYWTWSPLKRYRPGETDRQLWWGPLTRPGVPDLTGVEKYGLPVARFHDAIRIILLPYLFGDGWLYSSTSDTDTVQLTLRDGDGDVIGTAPGPEAQYPVPPEQGWYELELIVDNGVGNWMGTSVHTESTWRFASARPDGDREVLPLVQLNYQLDTDAYNRVPAGSGYDLVVSPGYQPHADGPGGFTVTVEVSYDDGKTWHAAPVETADGAHTAHLPAAPADAEFATVRVVATDADGNQLTQLIERGWGIG